MSGLNSLLDSNILIYLSKRELSVAFLNHFESVFISVISYMEVLGYNFKNKIEEECVKELISIFEVKFIDQKIADYVIHIRKRCQIKLPDAIIAGTAMVDGLCLVTRNVQDFKSIDCKILNPFNHSNITSDK